MGHENHEWNSALAVPTPEARPGQSTNHLGTSQRPGHASREFPFIPTWQL